MLTYDLRNCGLSSAANGGLTSSGIFESRDVVGSIRYARSRPDLETAKIALFSRCLGADSTLFAMERSPATFEGIRCLIACQPLSPRMPIERTMERAGIANDLIGEVDWRVRLRTSFSLEDMSPVRAARSVRVLTLVYQVHVDTNTRPSDVHAIFDAIPDRDGVEKELFWIYGTNHRWDGYLYFQRDPTRILNWLERHTR